MEPPYRDANVRIDNDVDEGIGLLQVMFYFIVHLRDVMGMSLAL